jgi:hypothetical protein
MTATLDHEVIELLARDPELLALADAVAAARREPVERRRRLPRRAIAGAIAAAALVALALVSPWDQGSATIVERARAAIGQAAVLHAVTRETLEQGEMLVDLHTGERTPVRYVKEQEIWFDRDGKRAHTITRTNGTVTDDVLETAEGGTSMDGPVITCAWIARHPAEATKERVSCRFDGDNSKATTLEFPQRPPSVDPALGGFLTQYGDALANGRATRAGEGEIEGRPVYWLSVAIEVSGDPTAPPSPQVDQRELVAVDQETYKPVLVRMVVNGATAQSYRVLEIETVGREDADFTRPEPRPRRDRISIGETVGKTAITAAAAQRILARPPLWLGRDFEGLKLVAIERQEVRTGYARSTGLPSQVRTALRLTYADTSGVRRLWLEQSTQPEFAFGWFHGSSRAVEPPEGKVLLAGLGGYVIRDGVYVAINGPNDRDLVVAAARALAPM